MLRILLVLLALNWQPGLLAKRLKPMYQMPKTAPVMKPMKAKHFETKKIIKAEPKTVTDQVVDRLAPSIMSNMVGGPAALMINIGSKFSKDKDSN